MRHRIYTTLCGAVSLGVVGIVAACSSSGTDSGQNPSTSADKAIGVVASTTQICDYVTQIAAGSGSSGVALHRIAADGSETDFGAPQDSAAARIDLSCLLAPNASAHEHEMSAQQSKALAEADLFLVSGVDLEHFLDDSVESTGFDGVMVATSGVLTAAEVDDLPSQEAKEEGLAYTIDRGVEHVDVAPWPFPPEDGESQAEFRFDPHVWTSPQNAAIQVKNIGHALEEASPSTADAIAKAVDEYTSKLDGLDKWAAESIDSVPEGDRVLFTSHDAFGYFSKTYGIKFEGAALSDFNAQQDATAQKIQETVDAVKESGAVAIFAENSNNPASIEKVAQGAGVRAVIGDEALYGDSLGTPGSDGETYIGSILHNVSNLTIAWNGKVAQIPAELTEWKPTQLSGS